MVNSRVQYDENLEFPVDTDFRRIGILRDPEQTGGGLATSSTYNALVAIKFPSATVASFNIDEDCNSSNYKCQRKSCFMGF